MVREPFVVGEVQPHDQPDAFAAVFLLRLRALKFEQEPLIEPERLPPALDAVPRLLCGLLVRAEIKYQIGLRHACLYSGSSA